MECDFSRISTHIHFAFSSDHLNVAEMSSLLRLKPTTAWEKGDVCATRTRMPDGRICPVERIRPWGVWHYITDAYMKSNSVEKHALFLLKNLEPVKDEIAKVRSDSSYLSIIRIMYVGEAEWGMSSGVWMRLAALCDEIDIKCWTPAVRKEIMAARRKREAPSPKQRKSGVRAC